MQLQCRPLETKSHPSLPFLPLILQFASTRCHPRKSRDGNQLKRIFYLGARHKITSLLQSISVIVAATTNQKYLHVAVESFVRFNEGDTILPCKNSQ